MKLIKHISIHEYFIGVVFVFFRLLPSFFSQRFLIFGDNYSLQVPEKIFSAYWLKQGIIPWWNPTIFSGIPWAHDISQTFFYPTTIIFTLLSPGWALTVSVALHLLFTYLGMLLLCKKMQTNKSVAIIGSLLWMLSTQVTGSINNLVTIQSIAWFPWVLLASMNIATHKGRVIFALCILFQFLAGYPQHVVYALLAAIFLSIPKAVQVPKTWLYHWFLTGCITLFVTCVAWLPFIEPFFHSTRMIQTIQQAQSGSLHPFMLIKSFIPYFFDNPSWGMKWGPAWAGFSNSVFYFTWIGMLILGIVCFQSFRKNWFLLLLIFIGIVFSFGSYLPGYSYIQEVIPFFRVGRYPSMMLIITTLLGIILIVKNFLSPKLKISHQFLFVLVGLCSIMWIMVFCTHTYFSNIYHSIDSLLQSRLSHSAFHTMERDQVIIQSIFWSLAVSGTLFTFSMWLYSKQRFLFLTYVIGLDLLLSTQGMLFFAPATLYPSWKEITQIQNKYHQQLLPQYRALTRNTNDPYTDFGAYWESLVVRKPFSDSYVDQHELQSYTRLKKLRNSLGPDWNMVYGVPVVHGYATLLPKDYAGIWSHSTDPRINFIDSIDLANPLLSFWSVKYYVNDLQFDSASLSGNLSLLSKQDNVEIYDMPALPKIRFENGTDQSIVNLYEDPNTVRFQASTASATTIVIANRYDANWKASINGVPALVEDYFGAQKITVGPGISQVKLHYIPQAFYVGLSVSVLSIIFLFLVRKNEYSST